ncbi:N(2)-fixation sustaining protein CowN [Marinospirillum sp.]|uniref:N(2)-fixation sustaining protein CowN n=1 Tax=Marinospirillum sp. TaxID=2183934 RepID=UPI00384C6E16
MEDGKNSDEVLDRYVSFKGIDCDGKASQLMTRIESLAGQEVHASPFWDYFLAKRHPKSGPKPDDLFLIHTNINQLYELFEEAGDQDALTLLGWLEENCC